MQTRMVLPEDSSIDQNAAGFRKIAGPLLVGGVDFLIPRTALFRDTSVRTLLQSRQQFEGYLEFRDQACKIAATQLVSMIKSPTDLLLATRDDSELFQPLYAEYLAFGDEKTFLGDKGDGSVAANIPDRYKKDIKLFKDSYFGRLNHVRSYFVYRKGLLKLNFIKWNSDPEEILQRLKSSTRWSEMKDHDLKRGLKSHMKLLKELEMSKVNESELENVAMKKINLELSLELEKYVGRYDWMLFDHYFVRTRYMNLARECATQAHASGIVLLEEALPIRACLKERKLSTAPNVWRTPNIKETVKKAFEGSVGTLHRVNEQFRTGGARWKALPLFIFSTLATVATVGNRSRLAT